MRIATIDVGTNTALLLIAERDRSGELCFLHEERRFVRLGAGVDAARRIRPESMMRLRSALIAYQEIAEAWSARTIVLCGTSASRDAENQDELIEFVRSETGLHFEILSGEDEAAWSFAGAVSAFSDFTQSCTVFDIGGGSTEICVGIPGMPLSYRMSLNVGTVRLVERCFTSQPPVPAEALLARRIVDASLDSAEIPCDPERPLVGAAGTSVVLAMLHYHVHAPSQLGNEAFLSLEEVSYWQKHLMAANMAEVMALNPTLMHGRADVLPIGVLIFECLMRRLGVTQCRISPRGLRHGLVLRYFDGISGP